jgi:hypothetical protein
LLPADVPIHLRRRRSRKLSIFCKCPTLSARSLAAIDWVRLLPTQARQTVSMQTESAEHYCLVVLSGCRADVLPVPASHSEFGSQFPGEVKMKRKHVIYASVGVVVAIALFVVYYLYLGSRAPTGQQPLVRLDNSNIDSLKKSFNDSADSVRVMVMLSPT